MNDLHEPIFSAISDETSLLDGQPQPHDGAVAVENRPRTQAIADVALYIDTDNQSSHGAQALLGLFEHAAILSAVIAGNNHGKEIESWRQALTTEIPDITLCERDVSPRKQAADIALIMELGAHLERHIRERERVVIVSRDELLISAAEHAKSRGCQVCIAYAYSENPPARSTQLITLLLPSLAKATVQRAPATEQIPGGSKAAATTLPTGASLAAKLRETCTPKPGGGYGASEVGQALSKIGFQTRADRTEVLKSITGLKESGSGSQKVLMF